MANISTHKSGQLNQIIDSITRYYIRWRKVSHRKKGGVLMADIKKFTISKIVYTCIYVLLIISPFTVPITFAKTIKTKTQKTVCYCDFCNEICTAGNIYAYKKEIIKTTTSSIKKKSKCAQKKQYSKSKLSCTKKKPKRTLIVYMAADNDLRVFAARNIQQMAAVGSNENITILVHLDIRISGNKKITRRYLIEKDKVLHVDPYNVLTQQMDSGNPATLISCCEWAIKHYPADEYDLILWNHGTGILEPPHGKIINPMDLFTFNPATHLLELDRSIGFIDALSNGIYCQRGICWDDTTGNYLSNKKLDAALQTIRQRYMNNKKFGVIGFDACLMAMVEISSFIKKHAQIMASSQEVELGMGWKYDEVLYPFNKQPLNTHDFACHIVSSYEKTYQSITYDYTFSAINLANIEELEKNINAVATLLLEGLSTQKEVYSKIIKESRNKHLCTHFDEPSYIDLHHLYTNLTTNIKASLSSTGSTKQLKAMLLNKLAEGTTLINRHVIANVNGRNLSNAHGISIYFPERGIHSSYKEASFLETNNWANLLSQYLFG